MEKQKIALAQRLLQRKFISDNQFEAIIAYHRSDFFSVRNELLAVMYIAVLMIAWAAGVLIYENIDTIGHVILISIIAIADAVCLFICFKKSSGYQHHQTAFLSPIYDYLVLLSSLLTCSLIGYLQFQYNVFGQNFSWATLLASIVSFALAYYFDNKASLSIAITSLAAFIGITITPQAVLQNNVYLDESLTFYGFALAAILMIAAYLSDLKNVKSHFAIIYFSFAMHLVGICAIIGMFETTYMIAFFIFSAFAIVIYRYRFQIRSVTIFAFDIIYSAIVIAIMLLKLVDYLNEFFTVLVIYLTPVYLTGVICLLTVAIRNFKKQL